MNELEGRPILRPGCRLSASSDLLLIPEGALRLQGPAAHIVQACDGVKTVPEIVATLLKNFPGTEEARVWDETSAFLTKLRDRAILEFV